MSGTEELPKLSERALRGVLERISRGFNEDDYNRLSRDFHVKTFLCENLFLHYILNNLKGVDTVYKIRVPRDEKTGDFYYIAKGTDSIVDSKVIAIFRGTYGYRGGGPYQSAVVEAVLRWYGYNIEETPLSYFFTILEI